MAEFIITFRETLEAALIVGIIATFLVKQWFHHTLKQIRRAVAAALVASCFFAWWLWEIQAIVGNTAYEKLFEAGMMYITAWILLYMVIRMTKGHYSMYNLPTNTVSNDPNCLSCELNQQSHNLKASSKKTIKQTILWATNATLSSKAKRWIFSLVFFAILREGFETALFLYSSTQLTWGFSHMWFWWGIIIASGLGYALFVSGKRIHLQSFFTISSVVLVIFAAGMATYGTHELEEFAVKQWYIESASLTRVRNILPPQSELPSTVDTQRWKYDTSAEKRYHILHDKGSVWVFLKGFFWYNSDPNIAEPIIWLCVLLFWFGMIRPSARSQE